MCVTDGSFRWGAAYLWLMLVKIQFLDWNITKRGYNSIFTQGTKYQSCLMHNKAEILVMWICSSFKFYYPKKPIILTLFSLFSSLLPKSKHVIFISILLTPWNTQLWTRRKDVKNFTLALPSICEIKQFVNDEIFKFLTVCGLKELDLFRIS